MQEARDTRSKRQEARDTRGKRQEARGKNAGACYCKFARIEGDRRSAQWGQGDLSLSRSKRQEIQEARGKRQEARMRGLFN